MISKLQKEVQQLKAELYDKEQVIETLKKEKTPPIDQSNFLN